ncbi:mercury methylation ferredoxin HgcB [Trichloromonas sp.]|uniref:mercury methylation ferredoxin HgcB n=1 Tax=Trichloromonas sp. TaxID=3069249 RepID=UPI003D81393C
MRDFRYLEDVTTLRLDVDLCIGCGRCLEVCPHGVFTLEVSKARLTDPDACIECGACAKNCPVTAIAVDTGAGCAYGLISEWLQGMNIGRKKGCR